jgi:CheY-like chemotaxis protein
MRILYVEDNLANLALVQRLARIGNHDVITHADGEAALAHFHHDRPDLVLMDIQLKGALTGLEVVMKLREQGHKTPIIAVTAYAMVGDRERCLEAGCDDYLPKPLPVEQLVECFQRYDPKNAAAIDSPFAESRGSDGKSAVTVSSTLSENAPVPAAVEQGTPPASTAAPEPIVAVNANPVTLDIESEQETAQHAGPRTNADNASLPAPDSATERSNAASPPPPVQPAVADSNTPSN